ncbi:MAG: hypothetical protein N3A72_12485, partial [bacterium]|nr:hypothetical protein [bacterium]
MEPFDQLAQFKQIIESLNQPLAKVQVSGLWGSGKAYLISELVTRIVRPVLIITSDEDTADAMTNDLQFFLQRDILQFPSWEILPYEETDPLVDLIAERMLVFQQIRNQLSGIRNLAPLVV